MSLLKKLNKNLPIIENTVFVLAFAFIMYNLVSTYGLFLFNSIKGEGYLGAIIHPLQRHQYYISIITVIFIVNATLVLWEILSLVFQLSKQESGQKKGAHLYKSIFKKVAVHYKSSFLALLVIQLLPKVILIHMFWIWLPHFQKLQLFTVGLSWYCWIYGYLCFEFASWLFHFSSHRVRLLWCLHSPHHAPSELNMTVNWVHFFAESYYSTFIHLFILMLFGINPIMSTAILSIDSVWGIFIHASERSLKDGRLGILQHFMITPSHHRVHHAKNPLYLDTNFANVLPIWDWLLGTLQPLRPQVKAEYGISRDLDVTNFSDLYFGELLLLYRDIKTAKGLKNKILYVLKPPGWTPGCADQTAVALRKYFLKDNPVMGITSREKLLSFVKSRFNPKRLYTKGSENSGSIVLRFFNK